MLVEHEPPCITTNSCETDVGTDDHVSEEEPTADKRVVTLSRRAVHHIVVLGVEAERSSGKTIGDQVDPKKLNGDKSLGHANRSGEEDGYNLSNVGRNEVANELLGVVVDAAALLDSRLNSSEVVIGKDHISGKLGHVGSRAHSDTNVTLLKRRSVVYSIASHSNNFANRLQEVDELALVRRLGAGEKRSGTGGLELIGFAEIVELTASEALTSEIFVGTKDTNLPADGLGSVLVVTGNDDDADTSIATLDDAVCDFGAGRIEHTNEAKKSHALLKLLVFLSSLCALGQIRGDIVNACKGHDTETLLAVLDDFSVQEGCQFIIERNTLAVAANETVCTAIENGFGGTLDEKTLAIATVDKYRHALTVSGEFEGPELLSTVEVLGAGKVADLFRGEFRSGLVEGDIRSTNLLCKRAQSTLGGLANVVVQLGLGVPGELGIVADSSDFSHLGDSGRGCSRVLDDLTSFRDCTHRREAGTFNVKLLEIVASLVHVYNLVDAHLVGGESSSLVTTDDTAAAESLDRRQAADDRVLLRHGPGSEGQTSSNDNGKTFGDGSNSKRHSNLEVVDCALGPVAAERGIVEVTDVDQPNENTDSGDDLGQTVTKVVQLFLERCRL